MHGLRIRHASRSAPEAALNPVGSDAIERPVMIELDCKKNDARYQGASSCRSAAPFSAACARTVLLEASCIAASAERRLTSREQEVLFLLARGMSRQRIARTLSVSPETVKTHVHRIYAKLEVHSRDELIAMVEGAFSPKESELEGVQRSMAL